MKAFPSCVRRLQPIAFRWKSDLMTGDVGFAAESVSAIEPRLATYNQRGEIEGVKYAQLTTVLVNAVKEQQIEIEHQEREIQRLLEQVEALENVLRTRDSKREGRRD